MYTYIDFLTEGRSSHFCAHMRVMLTVCDHLFSSTASLSSPYRILTFLHLIRFHSNSPIECCIVRSCSFYTRLYEPLVISYTVPWCKKLCKSAPTTPVRVSYTTCFDRN